MIRYIRYGLYVLIPAVIAQIFNLNAELEKPTETPTNEENREIENNHWQQKQKEENVLSKLKPYTLFCAFHLLNHGVLFLLKNNLLKDNHCFIYFLSKVKVYVLFCHVCL